MAEEKKRFGKLKAVLAAVCAVLLVVLGFLLSRGIDSMSEPSVSLDATAVTEQLENCQELATAKLEYRGLVTYEEGEIDFLTKTGFTMIYDATVRAGVDLSEAEVAVDGADITIDLPAATIQSVEVDADSLEFYDEKYALFNWQDREDTAEALQLAQDDAEAKAEEADLVTTAEEQAVETIETLFAPFTADGAYTLTVTVEGQTVVVDDADSEDATADETDATTDDEADATTDDEAADDTASDDAAAEESGSDSSSEE